MIKNNNFKKFIGIILIITVLIAPVSCSGNGKENVGEENYFVKAAWYFGREWPLNFWNSEWEHLDEDLQTIKEDGFNTVMLAVPWGEFQTGIEPIQYNEKAWERLRYIIERCDEFELNVVLRIGYYWDFDADDQYPLLQRYEGLLRGEEKFMTAWLDYVGKFQSLNTEYSNLSGSLICWEDFWAVYHEYSSAGKEQEERKRLAQESGFIQYLKDTFSLDEVSQYYQEEDLTRYEDAVMPQDGDYAMELFNRFFDDILIHKILLPSQEIYPKLGMEVRTDADVVYGADGEAEWYFHTETYPAGNAPYATSIYGIPMGFENNGEKVSAEEAIEKFDYMIETIQEAADGKPLFIDQFIFVDNTPGFENNAQVREDELDDFLMESADILVEETCGYALWTYRDYKMNDLYNSQFELDLKGWRTAGDCRIEEVDGNKKVKIEKGGSISQENIMYPLQETEYKLSFSVIPDESATVKIEIGEHEEEIEITEAGDYEVELGALKEKDLKITIEEGSAYLDNINLYYAVQNGQVYDEDMGALELADEVRAMNQKIDTLLAERNK